MTHWEEAERRAQCDGKEKLAADIAKSIALKHRKRGRQSTAYKCRYCKSWHVGTDNIKTTGLRR